MIEIEQRQEMLKPSLFPKEELQAAQASSLQAQKQDALNDLEQEKKALSFLTKTREGLLGAAITILIENEQGASVWPSEETGLLKFWRNAKTSLENTLISKLDKQIAVHYIAQKRLEASVNLQRKRQEEEEI